MNPSLLDSYGPLLNAHEMAAIWQITTKRFYRVAQEGAFDIFKTIPAVGPRCYSKQLVARYLAGEPIERERSTFGTRHLSRHRKAS